MSDARKPAGDDAGRRAHRRVEVEREIQLQIAGRPEVIAVTANVSAGGLFVRSSDPPPVGTRVKFALDLGERAIRGHGEVAWIRVRRFDPAGPRGMGLRIVFLLDEGERPFHRFLEEIEERGG